MTDQQLADRFDAFELPVWRDDAALGQLLTSYASLLPLRAVSELCAPKLRKRLLSLTEGVTVRICRLLEIAAVRAIESVRERIEADLLNEELLTHSLVSISDRHVSASGSMISPTAQEGTCSFVPKQLPICPRPLLGELLSSWLERVAVANLLNCDQLLDSLKQLVPS
jgi:hypothetical protein